MTIEKLENRQLLNIKSFNDTEANLISTPPIIAGQSTCYNFVNRKRLVKSRSRSFDVSYNPIRDKNKGMEHNDLDKTSISYRQSGGSAARTSQFRYSAPSGTNGRKRFQKNVLDYLSSHETLNSKLIGEKRKTRPNGLLFVSAKSCKNGERKELSLSNDMRIDPVSHSNHSRCSSDSVISMISTKFRTNSEAIGTIDRGNTGSPAALDSLGFFNSMTGTHGNNHKTVASIPSFGRTISSWGNSNCSSPITGGSQSTQTSLHEIPSLPEAGHLAAFHRNMKAIGISPGPPRKKRLDVPSLESLTKDLSSSSSENFFTKVESEYERQVGKLNSDKIADEQLFDALLGDLAAASPPMPTKSHLSLPESCLDDNNFTSHSDDRIESSMRLLSGGEGSERIGSSSSMRIESTSTFLNDAVAEARILTGISLGGDSTINDRMISNMSLCDVTRPSGGEEASLETMSTLEPSDIDLQDLMNFLDS